MSQKRPYEAVTGRQGLPGSGGQAATEFESAPEGPKAKVPRATSEHQWVRSGYVPEDVKVRACQEKEEEITKLKRAIHAREEALALKAKRIEIERLKQSIRLHENKQKEKKFALEQEETDKKLEHLEQQERKQKIKRSFQNAFKVKESPSVPNSDKSILSVTQSDVDRLLKSPNDYQCLQVKAGEPSAVIKKKYKELARAFHPDKCQLKGAKEAFQRLNKAYQSLLKIARETSLHPTLVRPQFSFSAT